MNQHKHAIKQQLFEYSVSLTPDVKTKGELHNIHLSIFDNTYLHGKRKLCRQFSFLPMDGNNNNIKGIHVNVCFSLILLL